MKKFNLTAPGLAPKIILLTALAVLAFQPVKWLIGTWFNPDYDSSGFLIFLAAGGLFIWSFSSPRLDPGRTSQNFWLLLLFTAVVRLAGKVLAINSLGALALVLDTLALALACGLARRRRALSPWWLAALFALTLPVERLIQRALGFGLQLLSARGAAGLLSLVWEMELEGVRLMLAGREVLVDLPCSGARGVTLLLVLLCVLMAVRRPGILRGLAASLAALIGALLGNVLRICFLSLGLVFPQYLGGLDVMAQPWHDLVGLVTLAVSTGPLLLMARRFKATEAWPPYESSGRGPGLALKPRVALTAAGLFLAASLIIVNIPSRPLDVSPIGPADLELPVYLGGQFQQPLPLSSQERVYFTRYGGAAVKALYGDKAVMLVRTTSPMRHLHAPDECLRGLGFRVEYLGRKPGYPPSSVYKAVSQEGAAYRVSVTFASTGGRAVGSVAEAVWHWLREGGTWTTVQRLAPWSEAEGEARQWDQAVMTALDFI